MTSQTTLLPLLRRELAPISSRSWRAGVPKTSYTYSTRAPKTFVTSNRWRIVQQRQFPAQPVRLSQKRNFSSTLQRRFASDSESFDPSRIERESDTVDVCIVGG
ncbi:hypothetical protein GX50_04638, partial [[Emmonsia] crescens]